MKYLMFFLTTLYCVICNANQLTDQIKSSPGCKLLNEETKHHVHAPDLKDNKSTTDEPKSGSAAAANAIYSEGPSSINDMLVGGVFSFFVKNDFSKDSVWLTIEAWACLDSDNCEYNKANYELAYYSAKQSDNNLFFAPRAMDKKGFFQNELIVKVTCASIQVNSKSTNIVNIY